jgi:hypothetical protein
VLRYGARNALQNADTASLAPARAEIIRSIVGRTRWLYEMASGATAVSTDEPVAPYNPQGTIGVDFSGPPFGPAFRHPIFWMGRVANSSSWVTPGTAIEVTQGGAISNFVMQARFFVRPFTTLSGDVVAPYARAQGLIRLDASAGTPDLSVAIRLTPGGTLYKLVTIATTTTDTLYEPADFIVPIKPGWNDMEFEFYNEDSGTITVTSFSLNQVGKVQSSL